MAPEETVEVKNLFNEFLVEARKLDLDRWKRFEDHCREDMRDIRAVIKEQGQRIATLEGRKKQKDHLSKVRPYLIYCCLSAANLGLGIILARVVH